LAGAGAYPVRVRLANGTLTNARAFALASTINAQPAVTVEAAAYAPAAAPGQIVALFGLDLVVGDGSASASTIPLPRSLQNATVYVNGIAAPLFFTSDGQINYQLPYATAPGEAAVVVLRDDGIAAHGKVSVRAAVPGIYTFGSSGQGQAAAQNADYSLNGDPAVLAGARSAPKGGVVILYGSGTGAQLVNAGTGQPITVPDGEAAGNPLPATASNPTATIGGQPATVFFSGLSPGLVGLWQLNLQVPPDAPGGAAVEVIINFGGQAANRVTIAIE
jgi:uncharacterized protein (TIGR03437 family)